MSVQEDLTISRRGILVSGGAAAAVAAVPVETSATPTSSPVSTMPVGFSVNGRRRKLTLDPRTTLLDALREHLQLDGTGRVAFGGLAHQPWRVEAAEPAMPQGAAAVTARAFAGAQPTHENAFKLPLATRTLAGVIAEARA